MKMAITFHYFLIKVINIKKELLILLKNITVKLRINDKITVSKKIIDKNKKYDVCIFIIVKKSEYYYNIIYHFL